MLKQTVETVRGVLSMDPTVPAEDRARILATLKAPPTPAEAVKRLLRRAEVASLLSCHPRTVDNLAKAGILRRVRFPGRKLAAGFMAAEVDALVSGKGTD